MDRRDIRRAIERPRSERAKVTLGDDSRLFPRGAEVSRFAGGADAGEKPTARVVVVTGTSAGVGRAVAQAFGSRGDAVALIARDPVALEEAAAEVEAAGGRALVLPLDVADADAVETAAGRVEAELG